MFEQLKKTHQRFKKFLRELQRADRHRKKRWLIGTTTVSMIIVIILWFFYINFTNLPSITQPINNNDDNNIEKSSFFETFKIGLQQINQTSREQIEQTKSFLGDQFKRTNEFILEGEQINSTSSEN